jgi:hypothetical protein
MFFKKLVEQHGVDLFIADGLWFALAITDDQVGIYFFYFLSHQSELRDALRIDLFFVAKAHRFQGQNCFAGFAHWLDILLESCRGGAGSELTIRIYKDLRATRSRGSADSRDKRGGDIRIADPDGVALASHAADVVADVDIVISSSQVAACDVSEGSVVVPDVIEELRYHRLYCRRQYLTRAWTYPGQC